MSRIREEGKKEEEEEEEGEGGEEEGKDKFKEEDEMEEVSSSSSAVGACAIIKSCISNGFWKSCSRVRRGRFGKRGIVVFGGSR